MSAIFLAYVSKPYTKIHSGRRTVLVSSYRMYYQASIPACYLRLLQSVYTCVNQLTTNAGTTMLIPATCVTVRRVGLILSPRHCCSSSTATSLSFSSSYCPSMPSTPCLLSHHGLSSSLLFLAFLLFRLDLLHVLLMLQVIVGFVSSSYFSLSFELISSYTSWSKLITPNCVRHECRMQ